MTHAFFSTKTVVRVAFAVLSLSYGVASAQPPGTAASHQAGDSYNWLAGGGG